MRTLFFGLSVALLSAASAASVACAPAAAAPPVTTTTSAGLENASARSQAMAPEIAEMAPAEKDAPPAGDLVCRTQTLREGTTELYLTWNDGAAKGYVRNVAPSGMVYVRPVHAERYKSMIIVDGPSEPDLASHTAVVSKDTQTGKPFMRVGDHANPWTACE